MPTRQHSRVPLQLVIMPPRAMSILPAQLTPEPHDDQNHDGTAQTVCLLQSAAERSDFSATRN